MFGSIGVVDSIIASLFIPIFNETISTKTGQNLTDPPFFGIQTVIFFLKLLLEWNFDGLLDRLVSVLKRNQFDQFVRRQSWFFRWSEGLGRK